MTSRRKLKFTRSFWLRLLAVGFFIGLGTFAVIQSTRAKKHLQIAEQNAAREEAESSIDSPLNPTPSSITPAAKNDPAPASPKPASNPLADRAVPIQNRVEANSGSDPTVNSPPSTNPTVPNLANMQTPSSSLNAIPSNFSRSQFTPSKPSNLDDQQENKDSDQEYANPAKSILDGTMPAHRNFSSEPPALQGSSNRFDPTGSQELPALRPNFGDRGSHSSTGDTQPNSSVRQENTSTPPLSIPPIVVSGNERNRAPALETDNPSRGDPQGAGSEPSSLGTNQPRPNNLFADKSLPPTMPPTGSPDTSAMNDTQPMSTSNSDNRSMGGPPANPNSYPENNSTLRNSDPSRIVNTLEDRQNSDGNSLHARNPSGNRPSTDSSDFSTTIPRGDSNNAPARMEGGIDRQQFGSDDADQALPFRGPPSPASTSVSRDPLSTPAGADRSNRSLPSAIVESLNRPGNRVIEGVQAPALVIEKLAPPEVQVNRPAKFEIVIRNVGRVPANHVQVHDRIPLGTELISAEPKPSSSDRDHIAWDLGTMEPGQEHRIQMTLLPKQPGEIGSVAQVVFAASASVRTVCTKPELTMAAQGPARVLLGEDVLVDITVHNKGNGIAESVIIQEDVPDGLEFNGGLRQLEYPLGNLRPGESRKVQLRLKAAKVGSVRNLLVAHAQGDLKVSDTVDIEIVAPKIMAAGQGPTMRFVNRDATHQFTISNTGTASATNLEMVATLPRGLKFKETNNKGVYNPQTHAVTWGLTELKPNQTGRIEVTTVPIQPGDQTIDFQVRGDLKQASQAQQMLEVRQLAEVSFDIDDLTDVIEVGKTVTYELLVSNSGSIDATNVQLMVEFPAGIRPSQVQDGQGNEVRGQQVIFPPIPRLTPNQELRLLIDAQGIQPGDHVVVASLKTEDRSVPISKEVSTHVYSD